MASYIKTLKDGTENQIIPRTRTDAVTTPDGELLETMLDSALYSSDEIIGETIPLNADTLEGHDAEYFTYSSNIIYDNIISGLIADNVKSAIDELANRTPEEIDANIVVYNNTTSGLASVDVQNAIDELKEIIEPSGFDGELVIYVDNIDGNDDTGNGSELYPYASLERAKMDFPEKLNGGHVDIYVKPSATVYDGFSGDTHIGGHGYFTIYDYDGTGGVEIDRIVLDGDYHQIGDDNLEISFGFLELHEMYIFNCKLEIYECATHYLRFDNCIVNINDSSIENNAEAPLGAIEASNSTIGIGIDGECSINCINLFGYADKVNLNINKNSIISLTNFSTHDRQDSLVVNFSEIGTPYGNGESFNFSSVDTIENDDYINFIDISDSNTLKKITYSDFMNGIIVYDDSVPDGIVTVNVSTFDAQSVDGQVITLHNLTDATTEVYTLGTGETQAIFYIDAGKQFYISANAKTNYSNPENSNTHTSISSINISINMQYGVPLLEYASWDFINQASESGLASTYWAVGDEKNIVVNGETLTMQIYGFNHDDLTSGGKAGITFGTKHLMASTRQMNSSSTNSGGWTSSAMRSWITGTLIGQMPSDLQTVLKTVNKLTSAGSTSSTINTTQDKVFLFSEIECFGSVTYSYVGEGSKYAIFSDNGSRIKKLSNGSGSASFWWERSPYGSNSTVFCSVIFDGVALAADASYSIGVAFGFCV